MDQKITCVQCHHWKNYDKESIEKFNKNPGSFDCELCHFNHPGHPKYVGFLFSCGFCNQVSKSDSCDCEEALQSNISTIKIVYDPNKKWMRTNKVNEKEEETKSNLEFNKLVRNTKLEKLEREKRMDKNLQRLVELMEAKVGV